MLQDSEEILLTVFRGLGNQSGTFSKLSIRLVVKTTLGQKFLNNKSSIKL